MLTLPSSLLTKLVAGASLLLRASLDALACALLAPEIVKAALLSASAVPRLVSSTAVASLLDAAGLSASFSATPDGDCFTLLHALSDDESELLVSEVSALLLSLLASFMELLPSATGLFCSEVLLCMPLLLMCWLPSDRRLLLLWEAPSLAASAAPTSAEATPGSESRPQSLSSSFLRALYSWGVTTAKHRSSSSDCGTRQPHFSSTVFTLQCNKPHLVSHSTRQEYCGVSPWKYNNTHGTALIEALQKGLAAELTLSENIPRRSASEHQTCTVSAATARWRSGFSAYTVRMLCRRSASLTTSTKGSSTMARIMLRKSMTSSPLNRGALIPER